MKQKLIKLLCEAQSKSTDAVVFDDATYAQQLEMEADHLIANGVLVLPCKVGETVYMIRDCSCYCRENRENTRYKCSQKVFLGMKRRAYHCGYVSEAKFELKHLVDFGKKVFLTRGEAETALLEMAGGVDND